MLQVIRAVSTKGEGVALHCLSESAASGRKRACLYGGFRFGHGNPFTPAIHDPMGGIYPGSRTDAVADGFLRADRIDHSLPEPVNTVCIEYDATSPAQTEYNQAES